MAMASVTTTKQVQFVQFEKELGAGCTFHPGMTDLTIVSDYVTQEVLQVAVDAHVAIDTVANQSTLEANVITALAQLQTSVDGLTAIIGKLNAEIGPADIKDIARAARQNAQVLKKVIRLVARQLDGTE
jgi:hypothetical protein